MQGPPQHAVAPDAGALAMTTAASLGEFSAIASAELLSTLSGMLVSEGLTDLMRNFMSRTQPKPPAGNRADGDTPDKEPAGASFPEVSGIRDALEGMLLQGVIHRLAALNTVNSYLSLSTAEHVRQWGTLAMGAVNPVVAGAYPLPQAPPVPYAGRWEHPARYAAGLPLLPHPVASHPYPSRA